MKVGDPEVVSIRNLFPFVDARQTERQAAVVFDFLGVHHVHVERWIGHAEIDIAPEGATVRKTVFVLIERIRFGDVTLQSVDSEVHLGQLDGGGGFFLPVERHPAHRVLSVRLDEVTRLHEHPTGTTGKVSDNPVVGLDHVDDGLHE